MIAFLPKILLERSRKEEAEYAYKLTGCDGREPYLIVTG